MGVDSYFTGIFEISPPLTEQEMDVILARTGYAHTIPDFYPWEISDDGDQIMTEDDGHRSYYGDEHLAALCNVIARFGHRITGEIFGENSEGEHWKYIAKDGFLYTCQSEIVYAEPCEGNGVKLEVAT